MLSKPTDLNAYRHEQQAKELESFLKRCHSTTVFFGHAYQAAYFCFDRYEVQCGVERYERSGEIPDYVLTYLKLLH